ncbi:MAG: hypothetical protein WDN08_13360 [Rhizomicrobium sp.]
MSVIQNEQETGRPLWLPHPALLALIAGLWTLAVAAQGVIWLSH